MDIKTKNRLKKIASELEETPYPRQIVIENTSYCNFRCSHCNHKELKRKKSTMQDALYKKIIDDIVEIDPEIEVWPTFYGEAFLLGNKLFDRLLYAYKKGAKNLVLNSNGSLLNQRDWSKKILTSGLKRFILSLDGFTAPVFESIRVGGRRDEIYHSVENLLKLKSELKLTYPIIQVQFSLMESNQHEFPDFKKHWEALGAEVKSRSMLSWTNSGSVVAKNLDYSSEFRVPCPWAMNTMAIHANGDVVACAVDYEGRFVAGNLNISNIRQVWNNTLSKKLRQPHLQKQWQNIPSICQSCPDWQVAGATYYKNPKTPQEKLEFSRPFWHN